MKRHSTQTVSVVDSRQNQKNDQGALKTGGNRELTTETKTFLEEMKAEQKHL